MAKNTKQGAQETESRIHQAIIDIFMTQGWEAVTYGTIAKMLKLSRSGVQRVVPTKYEMVKVFQGEILSYVLASIDMTSPKTIESSWCNALQDRKFANCIRYYVMSAFSDQQSKQQAQVHLEQFYQKMGKAQVKQLLGESLDFFIRHADE
ncbi:MAG: TetR/AcrR family transcriptional regulator [Vibrionaceae bacterium]